MFCAIKGCNNEAIENFYLNGDKVFICDSCIESIKQIKKNKGRQKLGETKKVSVSLPNDVWERFDKESEGVKTSKFLRDVVFNDYKTKFEKYIEKNELDSKVNKNKLGTTRKLSITLNEDIWNYFNDVQGTFSQKVRFLIIFTLSNNNNTF